MDSPKRQISRAVTMKVIRAGRMNRLGNVDSRGILRVSLSSYTTVALSLLADFSIARDVSKMDPQNTPPGTKKPPYTLNRSGLEGGFNS